MADGMFLGRDAAGAELRIEPERLRTHGVVVGMTGSGKTGLCVVMLEELADAGVPIIAIDPKGDLGNLALLFPGLSPEEFAPWVEPGADPAAVAARWREGLAGDGIDEARVAALRDRLDLHLYTPGSDAGEAIDVLSAFRRPEGRGPDGEADADVLRGLVAHTVSGLLALVGRTSDPVRDPAHVVLSTILEAAWSAGEDPDLETLILRLVDPPFDKVGVFPLDRFFPPDDRMDLAMALNAVVAAPSFAPWTRGTPLDMQAMLGGPDGPPAGRVPVHVFSLAHLGDDQRQLFLTLLLGRLHAWTRGMPGTSGLRAVLFFDEVAGYLPPHPDKPPTKQPLLTMMKQARAVGLGVLLATQNPVDIDYKALSNAGLWFIGRLQTAQDRKRLLQGLGQPGLDEQVAGLARRRFLLVDAKADAPRIFGTRWAMSYLRGPLTRLEIERVRATLAPAAAAPAPPAGPDAAPSAAAPSAAAPSAAAPSAAAPFAAAAPAAAAAAPDDGTLGAPPPTPGECWTLDPRVAFSHRLGDVFSAHAGPPRPDGVPVWRPALLADLQLLFDERNGFQLEHHELRVWYPLDDGLGEPVAVDLHATDLLPGPPEEGRFHPLPPFIDEERERKALQKQVADEVYRTESRGRLVHPKLKLYARGDESPDDFRARVAAAVQERVDAAIARRRERYEREADRLEDRIARTEAKRVEAQGVLRGRQAEEAVNVGETVLSWFTGRKRSVSTAMTKRRMTARARQRVERTEQELDDLKQKAYELERRLEEELAEIRAREEKLLDGIEEREVRLERNDITIARFGILWVPATRRL